MFHRVVSCIAVIIYSACLLNANPGRIEKASFFSHTLGIEKSFNIYLPEGYDESIERYPTVYICRGHEDEYVNRTNIIEWVDRNIENGKLGKMILVLPGLTYEGNRLIGFPVNMRNITTLEGKPGMGSGRFEDYFVKDLIPYVDSAFRTIAHRNARGIDGFSGGALTSILMSVKHPELFLSAGGYDGPWGYLDFDDPIKSGPSDDSIWMNLDLFDPYFGNPRDTSYMKKYNSANIISEARGRHYQMLKEIKYFIRAAGEDAQSAFIEGSYYPRAIHLLKVLASKDLMNHWDTDSLILSPDAEHNFTYAQEYLEINLPLHWKVLSRYEPKKN